MIKINKTIEIVRSSAPGLSSMSTGSAQAIQNLLAKHYVLVVVTTINTKSDLKALVERRPDLVFLGMKYVPSIPALGEQDPDKIWISKYLANNDIATTGSGGLAHKAELDKSLAKQLVASAGLATSPFFVAYQNHTNLSTKSLTYPLFVKPTSRGGGLGIDNESIVYSADQLHSKIASLAATYQADALVEQYLPGREFSVAIIKNEHKVTYTAMPLELIAPANKRGERILSEQIKSADTESCVEVFDVELKAKICKLALKVFSVLSARDYGRIDIRLDAFGVPHFLEANLIPSLLNGYGNFPKACMMNLGLAYEPMILRIVRLGLSRQTITEVVTTRTAVVGPTFKQDTVLLAV